MMYMDLTLLSAHELQVYQRLQQSILKLLSPMSKPVQFLSEFCEALQIQKLVLRRQVSGGWCVVDSFTQPSELFLQTECLQNYEFRVDDTIFQFSVTTEIPFSVSQHRLALAIGKDFCQVLRHHFEPRMLMSPVSRVMASSSESERLQAESELDRTAMVGVCVFDASCQTRFMNAAMFVLFSLAGSSRAYVHQPARYLFEALSQAFQEPAAFLSLLQVAPQHQVAVTRRSLLLDGQILVWHYVPMFSEGIFSGGVLLFRNVTEHLMVLQENEVLRRLPQESPDPMLRLHLSGKILYANVPAQYLLRYWQREVNDRVPEAVLDWVEQCIAEKSDLVEELYLGDRLFRVLMVPFVHSHYVNLYATDMTEQRRAEKEALNARDLALSASEAKSQFLAIMSHEIRTPLNAILGMLDVLGEGCLTADQADYIRVSQQAGKRLMALITNLLDISRIEAGRLTLNKTPFCLPELVQETLDVFQLRAREKGVLLQSRFAEALPRYFKGDGARLAQILFILLDNALKFTDQGYIRVHFFAFKALPEGKVQLYCAVEDTGIGIPQEKHESIFELFSQADTSTTREFEGSGLGLNIARQLVRLFDGEIEVSHHDSGGACFRFYVELEQLSDAEMAKVHQIQKKQTYSPQYFEQKRQHQPPKILIAEDSLENRLLLQAYLKHLPVELRFVYDGQAALDSLEKEVPDLILMDVQMPVMDGLTATERIRAEHQEIPIIVLSADALKKTRQRALKLGATTFVTKPIAKHQLLGLLDTYLQQDADSVSKTSQADLEEEMPAFECVEELRELLPVFFSVRREESAELALALVMKDAKKLKALGHRLRGASTVYGFPYFTEIGEQLESTAKAEDWQGAAYWVGRFDAYLQWTMSQLKIRSE